MTTELEKTTIAEMQPDTVFMPPHLWDDRQAIAKRVLDGFVPLLPWRDRLEFAQRLQSYREHQCDEHMAVLCAAITLTKDRAYGFNIKEWTQ